jgi:hypothetical protein
MTPEARPERARARVCVCLLFIVIRGNGGVNARLLYPVKRELLQCQKRPV